MYILRSNVNSVPIATLTGHYGGVGVCVWGPTGYRLFTAAQSNGRMRIWGFETVTGKDKAKEQQKPASADLVFREVNFLHPCFFGSFCKERPDPFFSLRSSVRKEYSSSNAHPEYLFAFRNFRNFFSIRFWRLVSVVLGI